MLSKISVIMLSISVDIVSDITIGTDYVPLDCTLRKFIIKFYSAYKMKMKMRNLISKHKSYTEE